MAGLTLSEIREALAAQLNANLQRGTNVSVRGEATTAPMITIEPGADYVDYWTTMGATGIALVRLVLVVDPGGTDESSMLRIDDYLSVGTGNNSSIVDAVLRDRTLGGKVDDCVILRCDVDTATVTARLPVEIRCRKVGAQT